MSFSHCHRVGILELLARVPQDGQKGSLCSSPTFLQSCVLEMYVSSIPSLSNVFPHPTVEVTVRGPVDEVTGMVINVSDLKVIIQKVVMETFDHKNVDKDVPVFR